MREHQGGSLYLASMGLDGLAQKRIDYGAMEGD
jgi:hypothetical protein